MQLKANISINLGKIQGRLINLKKGDFVELESTPEIKQLTDEGILLDEEMVEDMETVKKGEEDIKARRTVALKDIFLNKKEVDNFGSELNKFKNIKGIGPELANLLISQYKTFENFENKITEEKLEKLPGIGKESCKKIYELINTKEL